MTAYPYKLCGDGDRNLCGRLGPKSEANGGAQMGEICLFKSTRPKAEQKLCDLCFTSDHANPLKGLRKEGGDEILIEGVVMGDDERIGWGFGAEFQSVLPRIGGDPNREWEASFMIEIRSVVDDRDLELECVGDGRDL